MPRRSLPGSPETRWLYLGVAVFALLAALTFQSFQREEERRIGQSRAEALFELVQDKTPSRPTETPGVAAWLHVELKKYRRHIADPAKARLYGQITDWHDDSTLPPALAGIRNLLAQAPAEAHDPPDEGRSPSPAGRLLSPTEMGDEAAAAMPPLQFRTQSYLEMAGHWLVVTRRKALDNRDLGDRTSASNRFLAAAGRRLLAVAERLDLLLALHPLPATPGSARPRVVRLYAISEDGTLVSAPFVPAQAGAGALRRAALDEGREFRKLPELPSFISNEFVFRFDFGAPQGQSYYSGLYLDLGGKGVVATISVPVHEPPDSPAAFKGILATDLTFGIDWRDFAAQIEPPLIAAAVHLAPPAERTWRPWTEIEREVQAGGDRRLRAAAATLAARESVEGHFVSPFYLVHGVVEGQGAVAALQVAADTWLVILFPESRARFALLPAILLSSLLAVLLAGFETARRRTARAQRKAQGEWQQKQNLLNTMQVPLMVVDPNTDEVMFGNEAAAALGIQAGNRAADIVAPDPRARAHFDRMQVANQGARRAYGIPVRVRGEAGRMEERHAIIRSVAVAAPIEALRADERHRLAILFLLEPEADLALFSSDLVRAAHGDERRRLAGLLAHGLDSLTRVLAHTLRQAPAGPASPAGGKAALPTASSPAGDTLDAQDARDTPDVGDARDAWDASGAWGMGAWLAAYLERRVLAVAWLLEHWDAAPPLPPDSSIEVAQARATIEGFCQLFRQVRDDADLRSRLHWDNGVLAARPAWSDEVLQVAIDWPQEFWFACPLRGGFGFFLGEVLVNSMRHGRPGSLPELTITLDRVRRELLFTMVNAMRTDWAAAPAPDEREREPPGDAAGDEGGAYGGRRILGRMATLFAWRELAMTRRGGQFVVSWRVAVSERGDPRRAD